MSEVEVVAKWFKVLGLAEDLGLKLAIEYDNFFTLDRKNIRIFKATNLQDVEDYLNNLDNTITAYIRDLNT